MKRISIIGAGESGIGAALLAQAKGYEVFVSDARSISEARKNLLEARKIDFEQGGHSLQRIIECEELIKSPGVPFGQEVIREAKNRGIRVMDELEFSSRYTKGKIIAITGTNGKTTTALLTYHLLKTAGLDVGLAGNVGQSWAAQLCEADHEWWVLEVSSFQIDGFHTFRPEVAILTNITPDHLDRYNNDFSQYIQSKINLFNNMGGDNDVIYYGEDEHVSKALDGLVNDFRRHEVSLLRLNPGGAYFDQSQILVDTTSGEIRVALTDISLKGDHNMINVMCATSAAIIAGAREEHLREGLKNFKNAAHRMEKVEDLEGVVFVNDSKGTNVDATAYALASFKEPLIWIAGGVDKGNDYSQLIPWVKDHVKLLICLGKNNEKLKKAFADQVEEIMETQDIQEGVQLAYTKSVRGDVVLLSPACASFDLFKNYEDRGNQFKAAVKELKTKGK